MRAALVRTVSNMRGMSGRQHDQFQRRILAAQALDEVGAVVTLAWQVEVQDEQVAVVVHEVTVQVGHVAADLDDVQVLLRAQHGLEVGVDDGVVIQYGNAQGELLHTFGSLL